MQVPLNIAEPFFHSTELSESSPQRANGTLWRSCKMRPLHLFLEVRISDSLSQMEQDVDFPSWQAT